MKTTNCKNKRLFIFAAYDKYSLVDDALLYYLRALSKLGDIVFTMDNNVASSELHKVKKIPNILKAMAHRHGEYDFGSYKRGYQFAISNNILKNYDFIYFVNDSVYGPTFDLEPILTEMELKNTAGAFGMIGVQNTESKQYSHPDHVQSWFIGIDTKICTQQWFSDFIHSVSHQESKDQVVWKYEIGLSRLLNSHDIFIDKVEKEIVGFEIYRHPIKSIPFIKKLSIENIRDMKHVLSTVPTELRYAMICSIKRLKLYGKTFQSIWKVKIFKRLTILSLKKHKKRNKYILTIFKIIPITFQRY